MKFLTFLWALLAAALLRFDEVMGIGDIRSSDAPPTPTSSTPRERTAHGLQWHPATSRSARQSTLRALHLRWHHATSMFARLTLRIRGSQETGLGLT